MPLYEYLCLECRKASEILMIGIEEAPQCKSCGSTHLKKLLSASSSLSGNHAQRIPGYGDTTCCGSNPYQASCSGPGSCCGKTVG
jgi:putative FmdB family regulatory protein